MAIVMRELDASLSLDQEHMELGRHSDRDGRGMYDV